MLLAGRHDLVDAAGRIAWPSDVVLEFDRPVGKHRNVATVLSVLAKEFRLPLISNVLVNGHSLR